MLRYYSLFSLVALTGCLSPSSGTNVGGMQFLALAENAPESASTTQRRDAVGAYVAANFNTLIQEIAAGGGVSLTVAMLIAEVPPHAQNALVRQMRARRSSLGSDPAALQDALMKAVE